MIGNLVLERVGEHIKGNFEFVNDINKNLNVDDITAYYSLIFPKLSTVWTMICC